MPAVRGSPDVDPWLTRITGGLALFGAATLVIGTLVGGMVVPGHDPIADTVSDLAAGRYEWIQDVSLYAYAAGLLAAAIGAADRRLDGTRWTGGILMLALLGLCVTVIAARNEYGDGDSDGFVVHIYIVYLLGALFFAAPLAMARGLSASSRVYGTISLAIAAFWAVCGPAFFLAPTSVDGLIERLLGAAAAIWTATVALAILRGAPRDG